LRPLCSCLVGRRRVSQRLGFQNLLSCVRCACYAPPCSGRPPGSALLAGQLCPALTSSLTCALCWLQARCWRCGNMNLDPTDRTRHGHGCTSGRGRYAVSATAPWMPFGHGSQACQRALSIPPSGPVLEACTVEATPTKLSSNWLAAACRGSARTLIAHARTFPPQHIGGPRAWGQPWPRRRLSAHAPLRANARVRASRRPCSA